MIEIATTDRALVLSLLRALWIKKSPRYARAVYLRYFKDLTYREIAEELNVGVERARQIERMGMCFIKQQLSRRYKINDLAHALAT